MNKQEEIRSESLASEIYRDLKKELTVKNWIVDVPETVVSVILSERLTLSGNPPLS